MSEELEDIYYNIDYMDNHKNAYCAFYDDEDTTNEMLAVGADVSGQIWQEEPRGAPNDTKGVVRAIEVWILLSNGHKYKLEHIAVSVEDDLRQLRIDALKRWKKCLYRPSFSIPNMYKVVNTTMIAEIYVRDIS